MSKLLALVVALMLSLSGSSYAAIDEVQDGGSHVGRPRALNFGDGVTVTQSGGVATVSASESPVFTGDVTFQSTLLANGRAGGASTMSSSSTFLSAAGIAYSIIQKRVGGGGGLDSNGIGSTLPNGINGQVLTLLITALQSGGSWVITPTRATGWTRITMDTLGDNVTLMYTDSTGWIIVNNSGAVVVYPQLP